MTRLSTEIANRLTSSSGTTYGIVTALGTGTVGVRVRGEELTGVPYVHNLYPVQTVGDRVALILSGSGYLIVGKVTLPPREWNEPQELVLRPVEGWVRSMALASGDTWRPPDAPDSWSTSGNVVGGFVGYFDSKKLLGSSTRIISDFAPVWSYPGVTASLPSGSEVLGMRVSLYSQPASLQAILNGVPTTITLYGESPTVILGPADLSAPLVNGALTPWVYAGGIAPVNMGPLPRHTTGVFHLPQTWVDAFANGTASGLGVRTPTGQLWRMSSSAPSASLTITYRTPYVPEV